MARPKNEQPSYLLHKPSGQARVRIAGQDYYLGPHGSPESWAEYYTLLGKHAAGEKPQPTKKSQRTAPDSRMPIAEFIARHAVWVLEYYGDRSSQFYRTRAAVAPLLELYGRLPLDQFSPLRLQEVIERLVANGDQRQEVRKRGFKPLSRGRVNRCLNVLKAIFRWGVSQELFSAEKYQALETVAPLQKGLGKLARKVREMPAVRAVPTADIEAVLPHVQPEIAAMIRVQLLAGMRPAEICLMRPCDLDRSGKVWIYTLATHKNEWREQGDRRILIGPKAQKILEPFITETEQTGYLFSPQRVAARMTEARRRPGREGARSRNYANLIKVKPPRQHYDYASYGQAIERACKKADIPTWSPNQLRHSAGTYLRAKEGAEASQLALGHRHLNTTEIYAEKDFERYAQIMEKHG